MSVFKNSFPALYQKDFRSFWLGQCVSLIGTWMQNVAQAWLVLELSGSSLALGFVSALQFTPMLLFSLFSGAIVDRLPKKKILLVTQTLLMTNAFLLSILVFTHSVQIWHIYCLALMNGILQTLDVPSRQSFVIELSGREHLSNAIALNSAAFNLARIIGPSIAGLFIAAFGTALCFLLNGISFIAVLVALSRVQAGTMVKSKTQEQLSHPFSSIFSDIAEGLKYIKKTKIILYPLILISLISTFIINYNIVIPIFSKEQIKGGPETYGYLMTSMGIGSFLAALNAAARSKSTDKRKILILGSLGTCLFFFFLSLQHNFSLACIMLFFTGFFSITLTSMCNAHVQLSASDSMRGRVMSVYALVFGGVTPIGSLYCGFLNEKMGSVKTIQISAVIGLVCTVLLIPFLLPKKPLKA